MIKQRKKQKRTKKEEQRRHLYSPLQDHGRLPSQQPCLRPLPMRPWPLWRGVKPRPRGQGRTKALFTLHGRALFVLVMIWDPPRPRPRLGQCTLVPDSNPSCRAANQWGGIRVIAIGDWAMIKLSSPSFSCWCAPKTPLHPARMGQWCRGAIGNWQMSILYSVDP